MALHVAQGQPCAEADRFGLTVPVGPRWSAAAAAEFRAAYPSARALDDC